ncbi:hypothetical protein IQ235_09860 [Oscillatoriales cyanobacterium LEGE 11467]|uniref:Mandelate racemase/muconate lactonizing enzyme C-terminal domain-containing protein n=1 Tax=Zarconia navalis LEGE 11467 TaxID=1828826 RepID=A0A928VVN5_9CYAN|nr:enolase C-terminal domain-like protein [Zarconia navalis]MBE9041082.1 hypothetical protein [Zarconia navalis LEGE 11467]
MFTFYPLKLKLARPYQWAWGSHVTKYGVIVAVARESGKPIGWGEIAPAPHVDFSPEKVIEELMGLTMGLDPFDPTFVEKLDERSPNSRYRNGLISAVLTARAAEKNLPLADFMSSSRCFRSVKINGYLEAVNPEKAIERVAGLLEKGIDVVKIKCSRDINADFERVAAVSKTFPTLRLRLDPNGAWEDSDCTATFKKFQPFPIEYIEEPIPIQKNLDRLRELRKIIPIAADRWGNTKTELEAILNAQAVDRLILKSQILGGPDRTREIASYAATEGLNCVMTASLETLVGITVAVHCAATLPSNNDAHGFYLWDYIQPNVCKAPDVTNGTIPLPIEPGLGFKPLIPTDIATAT